MFAAALVVTLSTAGARIEGAGPAVERVRPLVESPHAVVVTGAVQVVVVASSTARAVVRAEENLQSHVVFSERQGTLEITTVGDVVSANGIAVRLEIPPPSSVTVHGVARVDAPLSGRARIETTGVAELVARGQAEHLLVIAQGASSVMARQLRVKAIEVEVSGAASVDVTPTTSLHVRGTGVAKVRYRGGATLEQATASTVRVIRERP
jgi:hypothetical protein